MNRIITIIAAIIFQTLTTFAQNKTTVEQYIQKYKDIARSEMQKVGIPASIKLAQGILESGFGNSELSRNANNHFGIKCHKEWNGKTYRMDDDEKNECFRVYKNPEESFHDHSHFLTSRSRYADLFKLSQTDYKSWAEGLQKAGYATNPKYATILIGLIERYELYDFDRPGGKEHKPFDSHKHVAKEPTPVFNPDDKIGIKQSEAIFVYNGLKTVRVQENDDIRSIARRYNIPANSIANYNDIDINAELKSGSMLYLQPKKNKAKQVKHLVIGTETMFDISQQYGVILDNLLKRNLMTKGQEPEKGETILLRKKATKTPVIRKKEIAPIIVPEKKPETIEVKKEEMQKIEPEVKTQQPVTTPAVVENKVEEVKSAVDTMKSPVNVEIADTSSLTHVVEKGDTLYSLSRKYGISVQELIEKNAIEDFNIKIGQTLIIK